MADVSEFWETHALPPAAMMPFELAVEELFANVVTHAADRAQTALLVWLDLAVDERQVTAVFADNGPPFDPTAESAPDTSLDADARRVGGLGLHLIRQMMDEVSYAYRDGRNQMTLTKHLAGH